MLALGSGSPSPDFEEEPGVGRWHRSRFSPPEGMGPPQGVAVNPWGSLVVTVDPSHLLLLDFRPLPSGGFAQEWERVPLPADLAGARPSGLCLDPFRNVVYLNTRSGQVWSYRLAPPSAFARIYGGDGP